MYDTARRVALVKQRVRENTRRRQRRGIYGLSAMCMLLFAALMQAAGTVVGPGQPEAWGVFGAMLLRDMIPTDSRTISTCREVWPFAVPGSALEAFGGRELSDHNAVWASCTLSK